MSPLKMFFGGIVLIGLTLAIVNMIFFQKPGAPPLLAVFGGAEPPAPSSQTIQPLLDSQFMALIEAEPQTVISLRDYKEVSPPVMTTKLTLQKADSPAFAITNLVSPSFLIGIFSLFVTWLFGPGLIRRIKPLTLRRARR